MSGFRFAKMPVTLQAGNVNNRPYDVFWTWCTTFDFIYILRSERPPFSLTHFRQTSSCAPLPPPCPRGSRLHLTFKKTEKHGGVCHFLPITARGAAVLCPEGPGRSSKNNGTLRWILKRCFDGTEKSLPANWAGGSLVLTLAVFERAQLTHNGLIHAKKNDI